MNNLKKQQKLIPKTESNTRDQPSKSSGLKKAFLYTLLVFFITGIVIEFGLPNSNHLKSTWSSTRQHIFDTLQQKLGFAHGHTSPIPAVCSGKGIKNKYGQCLCDIGYTGKTCTDKQSWNTPSAAEQRSVCLVVSSFGNVGVLPLSENGLSNEAFAHYLVASGYNTTVLYTGSDIKAFDKLVASSKPIGGLKLEKLPSVGLTYSRNTFDVASTSYAVSRFLNDQPTRFETVYFLEDDGVAYYPLLAKSQGLTSPTTKMVATFDHSLHSTDFSDEATTYNSIKLNALRAQVLKLADKVTTPLQSVVDELSDLRQVARLDRFPFQVHPRSSPFLSADELVFFATRIDDGSLKTFCDALDDLSKELKQRKVSVSFIPAEGFFNDASSSEYVRRRASSWDFEWKLTSKFRLSEALKFLSSGNRVAVIPSQTELPLSLFGQLSNSGIPFIASNFPMLSESVTDQSVLFKSGQHSDLSSVIKRFLETPTVAKINTDALVTESQWTKDIGGFTKPSIINDSPLVSIVMVRESSQAIVERAISAFEQQTYKNFEFVLVEEDHKASSDDASFVKSLSWQWSEKKGWKVLQSGTNNPASAKNYGAKHAKGKYILFASDKVVAKPHYLETLVRVATSSNADVATSGYDIFKVDQKMLPDTPVERFLPAGYGLAFGFFDSMSEVADIFASRSFFLDLGGFDEAKSKKHVEFYDFVSKVAVSKDQVLQLVPEALFWSPSATTTSMTSHTQVERIKAKAVTNFLLAHPHLKEKLEESSDATVRKAFERRDDSNANNDDEIAMSSTFKSSSQAHSMSSTLSASGARNTKVNPSGNVLSNFLFEPFTLFTMPPFQTVVVTTTEYSSVPVNTSFVRTSMPITTSFYTTEETISTMLTTTITASEVISTVEPTSTTTEAVSTSVSSSKVTEVTTSYMITTSEPVSTSSTSEVESSSSVVSTTTRSTSSSSTRTTTSHHATTTAITTAIMEPKTIYYMPSIATVTTSYMMTTTVPSTMTTSSTTMTTESTDFTLTSTEESLSSSRETTFLTFSSEQRTTVSTTTSSITTSVVYITSATTTSTGVTEESTTVISTTPLSIVPTSSGYETKTTSSLAVETTTVSEVSQTFQTTSSVPTTSSDVATGFTEATTTTVTTSISTVETSDSSSTSATSHVTSESSATVSESETTWNTWMSPSTSTSSESETTWNTWMSPSTSASSESETTWNTWMSPSTSASSESETTWNTWMSPSTSASSESETTWNTWMSPSTSASSESETTWNTWMSPSSTISSESETTWNTWMSPSTSASSESETTWNTWMSPSTSASSESETTWNTWMSPSSSASSESETTWNTWMSPSSSSSSESETTWKTWMSPSSSASSESETTLNTWMSPSTSASSESETNLNTWMSPSTSASSESETTWNTWMSPSTSASSESETTWNTWMSPSSSSPSESETTWNTWMSKPTTTDASVSSTTTIAIPTSVAESTTTSSTTEDSSSTIIVPSSSDTFKSPSMEETFTSTSSVTVISTTTIASTPSTSSLVETTTTTIVYPVSTSTTSVISTTSPSYTTTATVSESSYSTTLTEEKTTTSTKSSSIATTEASTKVVVTTTTATKTFMSSTIDVQTSSLVTTSSVTPPTDTTTSISIPVSTTVMTTTATTTEELPTTTTTTSSTFVTTTVSTTEMLETSTISTTRTSSSFSTHTSTLTTTSPWSTATTIVMFEPVKFTVTPLPETTGYTSIPVTTTNVVTVTTVIMSTTTSFVTTETSVYTTSSPLVSVGWSTVVAPSSTFVASSTMEESTSVGETTTIYSSSSTYTSEVSTTTELMATSTSGQEESTTKSSTVPTSTFTSPTAVSSSVEVTKETTTTKSSTVPTSTFTSPTVMSSSVEVTTSSKTSRTSSTSESAITTTSTRSISVITSTSTKSTSVSSTYTSTKLTSESTTTRSITASSVIPTSSETSASSSIVSTRTSTSTTIATVTAFTDAFLEPQTLYTMISKTMPVSSTIDVSTTQSQIVTRTSFTTVLTSASSTIASSSVPTPPLSTTKSSSIFSPPISSVKSTTGFSTTSTSVKSSSTELSTLSTTVKSSSTSEMPSSIKTEESSTSEQSSSVTTSYPSIIETSTERSVSPEVTNTVSVTSNIHTSEISSTTMMSSYSSSTIVSTSTISTPSSSSTQISTTTLTVSTEVVPLSTSTSTTLVTTSVSAPGTTEISTDISSPSQSSYPITSKSSTIMTSSTSGTTTGVLSSSLTTSRSSSLSIASSSSKASETISLSTSLTTSRSSSLSVASSSTKTSATISSSSMSVSTPNHTSIATKTTSTAIASSSTQTRSSTSVASHLTSSTKLSTSKPVTSSTSQVITSVPTSFTSYPTTSFSTSEPSSTSEYIYPATVAFFEPLLLTVIQTIPLPSSTSDVTTSVVTTTGSSVISSSTSMMSSSTIVSETMTVLPTSSVVAQETSEVSTSTFSSSSTTSVPRITVTSETDSLSSTVENTGTSVITTKSSEQQSTTVFSSDTGSSVVTSASLTSSAVASTTSVEEVVKPTTTSSTSITPSSATTTISTVESTTTVSSSISVLTSSSTTASPTPTSTTTSSGNNTCADPKKTYYPDCGGCYLYDPRDCAGNCRRLYVFDCTGNCVPKQDAFVTDCSGGCYNASDARIKVVDACGDCGGTNKTCTDCEGVLFGPAKLDNCGDCKGNDTACFKLVKVFPMMQRKVQNGILKLYGAGFPPVSISINGENVTGNIISFTSSEVNLLLPDISLGDQPYVSVSIEASGLDKRENKLKTERSSFILYDPNVGLNSIAPNRVYVGPPARELTLSGTKFFSYPEIKCVFGDENLGYTTSNFTLINDSTGSCMAPVQNFSRNAGLKVNLLYGNEVFPSLFVPTTSDGDRLLKYYETAPTVTSAKFSDSGAFIYLEFSKGVSYIPNSLFDLTSGGLCKLFLKQASTGSKILWNNSNECQASFISPTVMQIGISSRFIRDNIEKIPGIGDSVFVADEVFGSRFAFYSDAAVGGENIKAPSAPVSPTIKVIAPKMIDSCPDLQFDLSQSSGSGGRPFTDGAFTVTSTSDNATALNSMNSMLALKLQALLKNVDPTNNPLVFSLTKDIIPEGLFEFQFSLTNFLGKSSSTRVSVLKDPAKHIPYITINPLDSYKPDASVSIDLSVSYPCGDVFGNVINTWESMDGKRKVASKDASRRTLNFPAYFFDAGESYVFRVNTSYERFIDEVYSYEVKVNVGSGQLSINIGSGVTIGTAGTLRMQATLGDTGYPASNVKANLGRYRVEWSCSQNNDNCYDRNTQEVLDLSSGINLEVIRKLAAGTYSFSAVVMNVASGGAPVESSSATVTVIDGAVPSIRIISTDSNPSSWGNFALNTLISDTVSDNKDLVIKWQSLPNCEGVDYTTIDMTGKLLSSGRSLKFIPGSLASGSRYCMQATLIDPKMSKTGQATAILNIRNRPSTGYCSIMGADSGVEFSDTFKFSCAEWQTDPLSYPLYYSWDMKKSGETSWTPIYSPDLSPSFSTNLPQGQYTIRANIIDAVGGRNAEEQLIDVVVTKNSDPNAKVNFANQTQMGFQSTGNTKDAMRNMALLGSSAAADTSAKRKRATGEALKSLVVDFLSTLIKSGAVVIDPTGTGPQMLGTLSNLAGKSATITPELQGALFEVLNENVQQLSSNTEISGLCYAPEDAKTVLEILNVLINSASAVGANETVVELATSLTHTLESCMIRTQSCGQTPFSHNTTSLQRNVGVLDTSTSSSACSFQVNGMDKLFADSVDEYGCVAYRCGVTNASAFITEANSTNPLVSDLTFHDVGSNELAVNNAAEPIIVYIPLDPSFSINNNLSTYSFTTDNEYDSHSVKPECSYFDGKLGDPNGKWKTDGCSPVSINATHLTCKCTHLTSFAVTVVKVIQGPTTTRIGGTGTDTSTSTSTGIGTEQPQQQSSNSGPIIGAVAGGVVLTAALAVTGARRRQAAKKRAKSAGKDKNLVLPPGVLTELKDKLPAKQDNSSGSKSPESGSIHEENEAAVDVASAEDGESDSIQQEPVATVAKVSNTTKKMQLPPVPVETSPRIVRILANVPPYSLPPSYEEHMRAKGIDVKAQRPVKKASLSMNAMGTEVSVEDLSKQGSFDTINTVEESQPSGEHGATQD